MINSEAFDNPLMHISWSGGHRGVTGRFDHALKPTFFAGFTLPVICITQLHLVCRILSLSEKRATLTEFVYHKSWLL